MANVIWRKKPDPEGVVWHDLLDPSKGSPWVVTFTQKGDAWLVMHRGNPMARDEYIPVKDITEQQLRDKLRLEYLLTRGET